MKPQRSTTPTSRQLLVAAAVVAAALASVRAQAPQPWDAKFRAIPDAKNIGEYVQRMSARPHHLGSAYDKDNAEWILPKFKEWGWDARIEQFDVREGLLHSNGVARARESGQQRRA